MNRYKNISTFNNSVVKPGKRFYGVVKYPDIPLLVSDIYIITQKRDRYDLLANQYYGDKSLWWIIATANPFITQDTLNPPQGIQIRIPTDITNIINSYNKLNQP